MKLGFVEYLMAQSMSRAPLEPKEIECLDAFNRYAMADPFDGDSRSIVLVWMCAAKAAMHTAPEWLRGSLHAAAVRDLRDRCGYRDGLERPASDSLIYESRYAAAVLSERLNSIHPGSFAERNDVQGFSDLQSASVASSGRWWSGSHLAVAARYVAIAYSAEAITRDRTTGNLPAACVVSRAMRISRGVTEILGEI